MRLLIDSHLDLAWNALSWKRDLTLPLSDLNKHEEAWEDALFRGRATTCLPEMRRGGVMVCLGTLMGRVPYGAASVHGSTLDFPSHGQAWAFAQGQCAYYQMLEEEGEIQLLRTASDLGEYWQRLRTLTPSEYAQQPIGLVLAMEGADAVMSPSQLDRWWTAGLRVLSLVHYGVSAYAHGTGSEGPVTDAGRDLLANMSRHGMILDVTHLSDQSFQEAIELFDGPLIASHQNCRALVPGQRQFSDEALQAVIERGGVIGVALDAWMLHPEWQRPTTEQPGTSPLEVELSHVADHIEHICQLAGNTKHAAIGSDLDGGYGTEQTPGDLKSIADLQALADVLSQRGFSDADIDGIFHGNYLHFFLEHLP